MPYLTLTPADYLEKVISSNPPGLMLLTGESGGGKTSWCQDLVEQAHQAGIQPVGLLSPAVFHQGRKVSIDLVNIASRERQCLAVERPHSSSRSPNGIETTGWKFDPQVLAWGNQILSNTPTARLLILDEVGPLEFKHQQGLTAGMAMIDERRYQAALVVVRPSLLVTATQRWPQAQVIQVDGYRREGGAP